MLYQVNLPEPQPVSVTLTLTVEEFKELYKSVYQRWCSMPEGCYTLDALQNIFDEIHGEMPSEA